MTSEVWTCPNQPALLPRYQNQDLLKVQARQSQKYLYLQSCAPCPATCQHSPSIFSSPALPPLGSHYRVTSRALQTGHLSTVRQHLGTLGYIRNQQCLTAVPCPGSPAPAS
jgi:hypothetical protein